MCALIHFQAIDQAKPTIVFCLLLHYANDISWNDWTFFEKHFNVYYLNQQLARKSSDQEIFCYGLSEGSVTDDSLWINRSSFTRF